MEQVSESDRARDDESGPGLSDWGPQAAHCKPCEGHGADNVPTRARAQATVRLHFHYLSLSRGTSKEMLRREGGRLVDC